MLVIDSNPCVQWDKGAKEQRKKEASSKRSREGKSLGRRTDRDPEWRSFTPGDLQNPTDKPPTNTSNQPGFVQEVRPESCYIAQDFKKCFQSTVLARISCRYEQRYCISKTSLGVDLGGEECTTGSIIPPPPNEATHKHESICYAARPEHSSAKELWVQTAARLCLQSCCSMTSSCSHPSHQSQQKAEGKRKGCRGQTPS